MVTITSPRCLSAHTPGGRSSSMTLVRSVALVSIMAGCMLRQAVGFRSWHRVVSVSSSSSGMIRQKGSMAMSAIAQPAAAPVPVVQDDRGRLRVPFVKEGLSYWTWKGYKVHYASLASPDAEAQNKPPIVLIHGFGASVFHWRYNMPELAKTHRVYAMDLLGFGLSDKPIRDYNAEVWREQLADFLKEVVGVGGKVHGAKAVVVGNSLGGYTALSCAAYHPELIKACAVLNGAGTFDPEDGTIVPTPVVKTKTELVVFEQMKEYFSGQMRRMMMYSAFMFTKQPQRIKQVLEQVYVDKSNVDADLVESIRYPSTHPNAAEVFYRVVSRTSTKGALVSVNQLLKTLSVPLLLLWGDNDPWIGPRTAEKMLRLYPKAKKVGLNAGHCVHDEVPEIVNSELLKWVESLP